MITFIDLPQASCVSSLAGRLRNSFVLEDGSLDNENIDESLALEAVEFVLDLDYEVIKWAYMTLQNSGIGDKNLDNAMMLNRLNDIIMEQ